MQVPPEIPNGLKIRLPFHGLHSAASIFAEKASSSAVDSLESSKKTDGPCCLGQFVISIYQLVTRGLSWIWNHVFFCRSSQSITLAASTEKSAEAMKLEKVLGEFVAKKEELDRDKFDSWWKKRFATLDGQLQKKILLEDIAKRAPFDKSESQSRREWAETHFERWEAYAKQFVVDLDWNGNQDPSLPIESTQRYMQQVLEII